MSTNTANIVLATDADIDADIAALNAHTAAIQEPHRTAFAGPVVSDFTPGSVVWLWDHYNTAVVVGRAASGAWSVTTSDADGKPSTLEYRSNQLRPATEPRVFSWGHA